MNFLLTNDDGIDASGLRILLECMEGLGQVFTVAPSEHLSGCGHQVTSRIPIKVKRLKPSQTNESGRWTVHGTPVDCVRIAAKALGPENEFKIDWVLSGINSGGNLGVDIYTSGTVAASREAAILGLPSLAISHHINGKAIDWQLAKTRVIPVIKDIVSQSQTKGNYWNINLPQTSNQNSTLTVLRCPMDINPVSLDYSRSIDGTYINKGIYQSRPKTLGSDVATCFDGKISITELSL